MGDGCTLEVPLMAPMVLRTPPDAGLTEDLKAEVPVHVREWDGDRGVWLIADEAYRPLIERLVLKHFPSLQVLTAGGEDYVVDRAGRAVQARLF